jgi:ribonuclease P protein component
MVEAWRLNKHLLYEAVPADRQLHLFFIFTGAALPEYSTVVTAITGCIQKLATELRPKE